MRKIKSYDEGMIKTMIEQFAQLAMSSEEKRTFPSQTQMNPKWGSSFSSFTIVMRGKLLP